MRHLSKNFKLKLQKLKRNMMRLWKRELLNKRRKLQKN